MSFTNIQKYSQTVSQLFVILMNFGCNLSSQWRCGSEEGAAAAVGSVLCHVIGCLSSRHFHVSNNLPLETDNILIGPNQHVHIHLFILFQICTGGKHLCLQSISICCCCSALRSSSVVVCLPARETIYYLCKDVVTLLTHLLKTNLMLYYIYVYMYICIPVNVSPTITETVWLENHFFEESKCTWSIFNWFRVVVPGSFQTFCILTSRFLPLFWFTIMICVEIFFR